jgi:hypothetical protein
VVLEELPVDAGLVVVALEEGTARELDEVAVARVGLRERGQVVVELRPAAGVTTAVVDAPPTRRPLAAALVGHVQLRAEDGLDALLLALLVEVEDPVHVPVVGDPDRGLAVGHSRAHHVLDARRTVEHRVLGVDVEVGEAVGHWRSRPPNHTSVVR